MADLSEHTGELRALRVFRAAADLAQAERAERAAMLGALADRATRLGYPELRHRSPVVPPPVPPPSPPSRRMAGPGRRSTAARRGDLVGPAQALQAVDR